MEKIKKFFQNIIATKEAGWAIEHFAKPLMATLFLAGFFFVIIYYKNEDTGITDHFFFFYVFILPLASNIIISLFRIQKQKKGALFGLSVIAFPLIAISISRLAGNYAQVPNFYVDFQGNGSFFLIYLIYSVFFIIGGAFWGLIDEFLLYDDSRASIKYPEGSQLSKSKRRKMKKKKRGLQKSSEEQDKLLEEVIGPASEDGDSGEEREEDENSEDDDSSDESFAGDDSAQEEKKEKNIP